MTRRRITVSLDAEVASYLDSVPNRSMVVAEAVREYRARAFELALEAAYREDHAATAALAAEWERADDEVDE